MADPVIFVPLAYECSACVALNDPEFTVEYPETPVFVDDELTNVSSYGLVAVYLDGASWAGLRPSLLTIRGSALGVWTGYEQTCVEVRDTNWNLLGSLVLQGLEGPLEVLLVSYGRDVLSVTLYADTYAIDEDQQAEPIGLSCFEFTGTAEIQEEMPG